MNKIIIGVVVGIFALIAIFGIYLAVLDNTRAPAGTTPPTTTASSTVPTLVRPTLIYSPALNRQKAYVQLVWAYDFAPAFNIYRSTDTNPTWFKINKEPHPSGAHAFVDGTLPDDATVLKYKITPQDNTGNEGTASPVATITTSTTSGVGTTASTTYVSKYQSGNFSISIPNGYSIDENPQNGHGLPDIVSEVRFTIPRSMATGTNLSSDTSISVVRSPVSPTEGCTATLFTGDKNIMGGGLNAEKVTDKGVTYSYAKTGDAAAGNRYEQSAFALPGTNPCIGVFYFVHYSVIQAYAPDSRTEFDKYALQQAFDSIRRTLVVVK